MISFQPTSDLQRSAELTFNNMRPYYAHYAVDWEQSKILEQISGLENWDILYRGVPVGAVRIAMENDDCYLRDLQVGTAFQNKGIGAQALIEAARIATEHGAKHVKLRVFKISPAFHLYTREGFSLVKEDDRFYYMAKEI
ncbi:GNAT family N-acetyltransferase [Enterovibrio sp. ZSDZ35]|uniref:GNAT family N-acetyltransferase n=1 Tax=Enterovibrio qingdaonensis TaxID=2899818 RepID=A0ABT5QUK1_9GAMM|nr:GNAT family N-acetyltransferase [Enterovibrio sp. ZSDZ35]MDD1784274.1 GNAT family N-acetyltransferase [Enterovibrio sp. ZSDZ35]